MEALDIALGWNVSFESDGSFFKSKVASGASSFQEFQDARGDAIAPITYLANMVANIEFVDEFVFREIVGQNTFQVLRLKFGSEVAGDVELVSGQVNVDNGVSLFLYRRL